jgi:hypothetical protein
MSWEDYCYLFAAILCLIGFVVYGLFLLVQAWRERKW